MENAASDSFSLELHFSSAHFKTAQVHVNSLESKQHQDVAVQNEAERCRWQNQCQWHRPAATQRCAPPHAGANTATIWEGSTGSQCDGDYCTRMTHGYRSRRYVAPTASAACAYKGDRLCTCRYVPPIAWAACADSGPAARWPPISAAAGGSSSPLLLAPFSAAEPSDAPACASAAELPCCCAGPAAASA